MESGFIQSRERQRHGWHRLAALAASCWFCCLGGCLSGPAEEPEHHVPAHKPVSFTQAVERLPRLHAEIVSGSERTETAIEPLAELSDVVRWLPELAADSDLKEPEWIRVAAFSRRMHERLAQLGAAPDSSAAEYRKSAAEFESAWEELRQIAASSELTSNSNDLSQSN